MTRMIAAGLLALLATAAARAAPPFDGTAFLDPDIITAADPTTFTTLTDAGQAARTMFDRRTNAFGSYNAYLFQAAYSDAASVEIQVNPEFGSVSAARALAQEYAPVIGRLPRALRAKLKTVWIHQGDEAFGGGNENLLIHTGSFAQQYVDLGVLEEIFVHEASHTSLDPSHAAAAGWLAAQQSDPEFISTYARDNPTREDVAESFVPWLAVACRRTAIDASVADTIEAAIPARLAYFGAQGFDLSPVPCVDPDRVLRDGFEGG